MEYGMLVYIQRLYSIYHMNNSYYSVVDKYTLFVLIHQKISTDKPLAL